MPKSSRSVFESLEKNIMIALQEGSMCSPRISDIAKKIGKSPATIFRKIKELEQNRIIKEYVAHIDPERVNRGLTTFVKIQIGYPRGKKITHEEFLQEYIDYFDRLKEVQEIYVPVGTWDLMLKIKVKDIKEQYHFISERIMPLANIRRMESVIMMRTAKERTFVEPE